jgi:membrane associated rhomboid family serine protease
MEQSTITFVIIGITCLVSYLAFSNTNLFNKLIFYPSNMKATNEWYRFVTHGFIHADFQHLAFNMFTMYFFGGIVENVFHGLFGNVLVYPLYYLLALFFSSIPSYQKNRSNSYYRSLGASGAVSAVLFSTILFDPWMTLRLYFAIPIPAILFAIGYVAYSMYMSRKGNDHIGHDAHLSGALFGLLFPILLKPSLINHFITQLTHPRF